MSASLPYWETLATLNPNERITVPKPGWFYVFFDRTMLKVRGYQHRVQLLLVQLSLQGQNIKSQMSACAERIDQAKQMEASFENGIVELVVTRFADLTPKEILRQTSIRAFRQQLQSATRNVRQFEDEYDRYLAEWNRISTWAERFSTAHRQIETAVRGSEITQSVKHLVGPTKDVFKRMQRMGEEQERIQDDMEATFEGLFDQYANSKIADLDMGANPAQAVLDEERFAGLIASALEQAKKRNEEKATTTA